MKKILLIILPWIHLFLQAQPQTNYENEKISKIISPPSQEAYKLGTFGSIPVGLINGTPNINIPLISINSGTINLPFSLNYSKTGVLVDELEGTAGLSWQFVGGGVITRTVKDLPDEDGDYHFPDFNISQGISTNDFSSFSYLDGIQEPFHDNEPDIYNYQFLGKNGKFIFDSQQNIVQLDQSDLKIIRKSAPNIGYFYEIIDVDGTVYEFKEQEKTLTLKSSSGSGPSLKISAWFLNRIYNPNTAEEISLIYESNDYTYVAYRTQFLKFDFSTNLIGFDNVVSQFSNYPAYLSDLIDVRIRVQSKVLQQVNSSTTSVINFNYIQDNIDVPKRLINITLKDSSSAIVENINLLYTHTPNSRVFLNRVENTTKKAFYLFEYNNPQGFPARLTYAQDYYGYYNGRNTNITLIPNTYANLYSHYIGDRYNSLAERIPDASFNKYGLLSKISYPTKGYSLLNYEGVDQKTAYIYRQIFIPDSQSFNLGLLTYDIDEEDNVNVTGLPMSYLVNQQKTLYFQGYTELSPNCLEDGQPIEYLSGFLKIYKDGISFATRKFISKSEVFQILLPAGNYTFSIENVFLPCTKVFVNVGDQPFIPAHYELQQVGYPIISSVASRLASVITKDSNNNLLDSVYYKYRGLQNSYPFDFKSYSAKLFYLNQQPYVNTFMHINSQDQKSFVSSSQDYLYSEVDISFGGSNFEKGGETHIFNITPDSPSSVINGFQNNDIKMYSYVSWDNARESKINYFNSNRTPLKSIEYFYGERQNNNKIQYGIIAHEIFQRVAFEDQGSPGIGYPPLYALPFSTIYTCSGNEDQNSFFPQCTGAAGVQVGSLLPLYNVQISQYAIGSYNKFIKSKKTTDYLNSTPLLTTTEYFYNNPSHYQLTSQKTIFPDESTVETSYQYAHEKGKTEMIAANMIGIPLETSVVMKKDSLDSGKIISKTETKYDNPISLLPSSVLSYDLQSFMTSSTEVTYDSYDNKGNLLQYTTKAGTPTAIIWGYSQTHPIAKIEGATYAQVSGHITDIVNYSNIDASVGSDVSEQDLIDKLDAFRKKTELSGFQITTYTYDPLIGVRNITPPSGIREIYIYDTANRLQTVKDVNKNILKEYQYHYKP